tara:strand:- start:1682 stop:3541 length:1860 start_codon:yes stop_codon:yes gene_type:complete
MANYHAVYIDSPASWTYNTDSYDSKLGFYSNAWLTNETEETSETPVISCSYFYELGKQDEVGFTPRRISMSESSGILTVEGKQENVSSLVSKSFRLNSPSPRFLNLRESMRKRRPARFIVNNIITDDDAELNNIKDYLGLNEEEAEAISRSEEFGAEEYFEYHVYVVDDASFGDMYIVDNARDFETKEEAIKAAHEVSKDERGKGKTVYIVAEDRENDYEEVFYEINEEGNVMMAEDFGAEAYEGFEQGNHHIEDKYFYELTEREDEYWSGGQNKLNPVWGNESFINALITENQNEENYSPKMIVDFLLETLKQKEKELNIIQRRYKDENIKTFLRRNPFTSRRVMNPDFGDNMTGMTPSEGWGSAWINIAIKSLNQEIDDVYERDMNKYGDMPDGAWDYVGELQEVRKQLRRDRNLVFGVPYDAESFEAEEFDDMGYPLNMRRFSYREGTTTLYQGSEVVNFGIYFGDEYMFNVNNALFGYDEEGVQRIVDELNESIRSSMQQVFQRLNWKSQRHDSLDVMLRAEEFGADTADVDFDEAYMERQDAERIMKLLKIVKRKATGSNARYAKTYAREAENAYYQYGMRGLTTQVAYVLSNLSGWRGEEAKSVKAELRKLIK